MRVRYWLVLCLVVATLPGFAANPFGEESGVSVTTTRASSGDGGDQVPADVLKEVAANQAAQNQRNGAFPSRVLSQPIVKARIVFKDVTGKYQRIPWIEKTFQAHGVTVLVQTKKEGKKGGFLGIGQTKWMDVTYDIEGREFVAQMLCSHYGGSVGEKVRAESVPPLPDLDGVLEIDRKNVALERQIVQLRLEYDTKIQVHDKSGLLSGERRAADARMKAIIIEIETLKNSFLQNLAVADQLIFDKGLEYQKNKDYETALGFYNLHGINDTNTRWYAGFCYKELGQYEQAVGLFRQINSDQARLQIAEIRNLQGDKAACADELMNILKSFRNTEDQQKALAKFDEWGLLAGNTELSEKVAAVYLTKAFQLQQGNNAAQAAKDYKRACELRAATAGSAAAASRAIVAGYSKAVEERKKTYEQAQISAEQRFYREQDEAMRAMTRAEESLRTARRSAQRDYEEELSRLSYEIQKVREEIREAEAQKPPAGNTDPYGGTGTGSGNTDPYGGTQTGTKTGSGNTDPYGGTKTGSGNTDPYGGTKTGSGNTDPYGGTKTGSGNTDPYGGNGDGNTDPYQRQGDTDPYGSGTSTGTDPYSPGGSGTGTDPYSGGADLDSLRTRLNRLVEQERWLRNNEGTYIADRTLAQREALATAERNYRNYDLSKKSGYVTNDATVKSALQSYQSAQASLTQVQAMAKGAGF